MDKRYVDGVLAYVDGAITPEYRDVLIAELKDVDKTIKSCTEQIGKWSAYALRSETEQNVPSDLKQDTIEILDRKKKLLKSAERYRAYIINELHNQPKYAQEFVYKQ